MEVMFFLMGRKVSFIRRKTALKISIGTKTHLARINAVNRFRYRAAIRPKRRYSKFSIAKRTRAISHTVTL